MGKNKVKRISFRNTFKNNNIYIFIELMVMFRLQLEVVGVRLPF